MISKNDFNAAAFRLYDFCEYPAVRHKIESQLLDTPSHKDSFTQLHNEFLKSDIVDELYEQQDEYGGWGPLQSKDYSVKAKFPTSLTAIERCLYIGLSIDDRDLLFLANEYLESFLEGTNREPLYTKNERAIPWQKATISTAIESIQPNNKLCDSIYQDWLYIANRTFEDGLYSYERERLAQHDVFLIREDRLVPMQFQLLLKRPDKIDPELEDSMLRYYGEIAYHQGYFWDNCPQNLPSHFYYAKTRRWFHSFHYINQFHNSSLYLDSAIDWLWNNRNGDGLWDWGPQIKDPWGYFHYFSTNRHYNHNRIVDCSMEILHLSRAYLDKNQKKNCFGLEE